MTGNKGIICHKCKLEIHGKKRIRTWSELSVTANIGDTQIKVIDKLNEIDWTKGEEIAIASTSFNHL